MTINPERATQAYRFLTAILAGLGMFAWCPGKATAQPIRVGTEFVRYTPTGEVFPQDRPAAPLEALSPPLVRGMWNSFRIILDVEPGVPFKLFLAQNPENAMQTRVFREVVSRAPEGWRVERREFVPLPFRSDSIPERERSPERTTYTFWLDVRPPRDYPAERLKLEAQVVLDGQWFIHPMEIRVLDLELTTSPPGQGDLPAATMGTRTADLPYRDVIHRYVCAEPGRQGATLRVEPGAAGSLETHAARAFDFVLDALTREEGREVVLPEVEQGLRIEDRAAWCLQPAYPTAVHGPEWPAVLRNRLLRLRGNPY